MRSLTVDGCRDKIRDRNEQLGAVLTVLDQPQRDSFAPVDAPLAGVPYVLKDTWDTARIPTTGGSWRHRDRIPEKSGSIHTAIARAGAVLLGKSNLPDLAFSPETDNHLRGPTRNPYDPTRTAGGSTGGGAAAVASGMAAFDWGADFGGSIRTPAACCGVVGLRLSSATWPAVVEHFPSLPPILRPLCGMGPITRTVADCRALLAAVPSLRNDIAAPIVHTDEVRVYAPDERTTGAWPTFVADAAVALRSAGVRFEVLRTLPGANAVNNLFNAYLSSHIDDMEATGEIPRAEAIPAVLLGLLSGGRLDRRIHPGAGILIALSQIGALTLYRDGARYADGVERLRAQMAAVWRAGHLVVAPTATLPPPRLGRSVFSWTWQAYTKLGNLTDATALALPFGRFPDRLPRSLQILGPPGSEQAVLDLAARLEAVAPR